MKISRLAIADYQQFKWLDLDLTYRKGHPKAGQPLDKVCFIGANGTGKTTLLEILDTRLHGQYSFPKNKCSKLIICFDTDEGDNFCCYEPNNKKEFFCEKEKLPALLDKYESCKTDEQIKDFWKEHDDEYEFNRQKLVREGQKISVRAYLPVEGYINRILEVDNLPETSLSEALNFKKGIEKNHLIANDNFKEFWKLLIYHTNKRMSDEVEFLNANENEVVGKLKRKFAATNPDILEVIAELWAKILDPAGLYFDYEKAKRPFQLLDNLEAYIKLKSTDKVIPYNKLSSGIRDMIFRFGYLKALYFGRDIDWATALIDEPENSLFVDLQYNIIELYEEVCPNTQLFFATHSPIIAAQFHPDERVILEFDEEGYVTASRGVAAEGDDPNDVLVGDFKRETVLGKVGEEKWQRYVELIHLMENETDEKKKVEHAKEFMKIGSDYKFGAVMPD